MAAKKSTPDERLSPLRRRIDEVSQELLRLLNERARLALEIGQLKRADGAEVYQPLREQEILAELVQRNPGPLSAEHVRRIFTEVISACRALERELRVAFLGPEFTYSHQAALIRFGHSAEMVAKESIAGVFSAVEAGRADLALVPVENSTEGPVPLTLDALLETPLQVVGEVMLPVRHALLSRSGDRSAVRRILAHQQSLGQCRNYLAANFPRCEQEAVASNALAARRAGGDPDAAAIAWAEAGPHYGLKLIEDGIQDVAQNITRFLVLGREAAPRSGSDKTGVIFAVPERAGALKEALTVFARNGINLTMIQSRPQRGRPWEYLFYADLRGHRDDPPLKRSLALLKRKALFLKVLGSYPEATPAGS